MRDGESVLCFEVSSLELLKPVFSTLKPNRDFIKLFWSHTLLNCKSKGNSNFLVGMYVYGWGGSFVHGSVGIHVPFIYIIHDMVLLIISYCTELASPRCVVLCASTSEQLSTYSI